MKQVFKRKSLKLGSALFVLFLVLRLIDIYLCLVLSTRVGRLKRKSKQFRLSWGIVKQWVLTAVYAVIIPSCERFIWALILIRCFYWSIFFCFSFSLHRSFISTIDNHQTRCQNHCLCSLFHNYIPKLNSWLEIAILCYQHNKTQERNL